MSDGKSSVSGGEAPVSLNLGVIGNCAIGALVDARARIVWCCMPRFDGDPVFYSLLDSAEGVGHDGTFAIELEGITHSEQFYDSGTAVLRTRVFDETWFSLRTPVSLLLGSEETLSGGIEETARDFEEQTRMYWREWTRRLAIPREWQEAVIRAAITLKLCQYEETGAIVAALTT